MKQFAGLVILLAIACMSFKPNTAPQASFPFDVKKTGNGAQSIVFIPGFASSGAVWNDTKAMYEKDFTCYTLTMAGFAGVAPQADPAFENWEKNIAAFIRQNNIQKPILIGHSMGGALAMAVAADYPELVSKIIVVDALPCLPALRDPAFTKKETPDCSAVVSQLTAASSEQFYQMQKQTIPMLVADTTKQALVMDWSVKSDRATFAEMYCDFSNTDLRTKISTITCPALVLLESYFANVKPAINEQFKNLKTADLRYATKGLHFIMYDDKEWYNQQLSAFIKP